MAMWLRRAMTTGLRRGMAGSRGWLVIGIVAAGGRALMKLASKDPEILYRTVVQPGEVFEIVTAAPARKGRKS